MRVKILSVYGLDESLFGLGLSYGVTSDYEFEDYVQNEELKARTLRTAYKLSSKDGGHNKFLESIQVWLDIQAPRYLWQEFDTYRAGVTKQSESTIHTIKKKTLSQSNFESPVIPEILDFLNILIENGASMREIKNHLPEGFLQRRIVSTNYKAIRNMYFQRRKHKLEEWHVFINEIKTNLPHNEWIFAEHRLVTTQSVPD